MGMSPSRMPQNQGMMGSHANNMVAQPANQGQFLPQGQFTAAAGGAMNVGMGQPISQAAVTQVRRRVQGLKLKSLISIIVSNPSSEELNVVHCFQYIYLSK